MVKRSGPMHHITKLDESLLKEAKEPCCLPNEALFKRLNDITKMAAGITSNKIYSPVLYFWIFSHGFEYRIGN